MREPRHCSAERPAAMLSLQRCREAVGRGSDAELESLRDQLYALAEVAVSAFLEFRAGAKGEHQIEHERFNEAIGLLPSEDAEGAQERAAIVEFDGGQCRDRAERHAILAVVDGRSRRNERDRV